MTDILSSMTATPAAVRRQCHHLSITDVLRTSLDRVRSGGHMSPIGSMYPDTNLRHHPTASHVPG